jgi:hypothetical protein
MFHNSIINQVCIMQLNYKMYFYVFYVLYSQFYNKHVSAASAAIFRVMLLKWYKGTNMVSYVAVRT